MPVLESLLAKYLLENFTKEDAILFQKPISMRPRKRAASLPAAKRIEVAKEKPKEEPKPKQTEEAPKEKEALKLQKPVQKNKLDTAGFATLYKKIAPHIPLHEAPPKDSLAMSVRNAHKDHHALVTVPIFASPMVKEHANFLINLAKAIDTIAPCKVIDITEIEEEDRWNQLLTHEEPKLIIVPEKLLFASKNLLVHYREVGQTLFKKLSEIPTLVLKDIDVFYRSPAAKQSLWKILQEEVPKFYER